MAYRPKGRVFTPAASSALVVSIATMRDHLRVTDSYEDGIIADCLRAAQMAVERATQRLLVRRSATLQLPGLPSGIEPVELPGGEVASITSVMAEGSPVTGSVAIGHSPAVLVPSADWPVITADGYPVTITYVVGYDVVPGDLQVAIKLIADDLFHKRGHSSETEATRAVINADWLIAPHRIRPI